MGASGASSCGGTDRDTMGILGTDPSLRQGLSTPRIEKRDGVRRLDLRFPIDHWRLKRSCGGADGRIRIDPPARVVGVALRGRPGQAQRPAPTSPQPRAAGPHEKTAWARAHPTDASRSSWSEKTTVGTRLGEGRAVAGRPTSSQTQDPKLNTQDGRVAAWRMASMAARRSGLEKIALPATRVSAP